MRDSGVEFLGEVPSQWGVQPAVTLARVLTSTVDKKSYEGEQSVKLCNYTDVYYSAQIVDNSDFMVATATSEQIAKFSVRAGDVPFTKDSETADDIGIPSYVPKDLPGTVYGYHLSIFRPIDKRRGRFLKYLLESDYAKAYFETKTPGVTRVGLGQSTIRYFRAPTPPVDEAVAIADYLDRETAQIDAFIAKNEELITLLTERRVAASQATVEHHVGNGSRLKYHLREIDVRAGGKWEELPMLSVSIHRGVMPRESALDSSSESSDLSHYKVVNSGDIVLNRMRAFQGGLGVAPCDGLVSPDYAVLRPDNGVNADWLSSVMRTPRFVAEMAMRLRGIGTTDSGAVRTPRISVADVGAILVDVPTSSTQRDELGAVTTSTERTEAARAVAERTVALARERRAALISAAVTGKIDVGEA